MPRGIVDEAQTLLQPGDERAEELIDQIRQRRDDIAAQQLATEQAQEEVRLLRRRAAQSIREAEELKRTARDEAIAQVEEELEEARVAIRELERAARAGTTAPNRIERNAAGRPSRSPNAKSASRKSAADQSLPLRSVSRSGRCGQATR
jgi:dsDNA-specific endonuclease/ATPase MutS2